MTSIEATWPSFNQQDGLINDQDFPGIMIRIAEHQGLLDETI